MHTCNIYTIHYPCWTADSAGLRWMGELGRQAQRAGCPGPRRPPWRRCAISIYLSIYICIIYTIYCICCYLSIYLYLSLRVRCEWVDWEGERVNELCDYICIYIYNVYTYIHTYNNIYTHYYLLTCEFGGSAVKGWTWKASAKCRLPRSQTSTLASIRYIYLSIYLNLSL